MKYFSIIFCMIFSYHLVAQNNYLDASGTRTDTAKLVRTYVQKSDMKGTLNYIPKFLGTNQIGNSQIFDDGTKVGVGTNNPTSKLEVNGVFTNATAFNASSSSTIDFSKSNLAYTSLGVGAFNLTNMKDGGVYMLALQGSGAGISTFSGSNPSNVAFTFIPLNENLYVSSTNQAMYQFFVMGTTVYYSLATLRSQGFVTFSYTGQAQNWVVPVGVTSIAVTVIGSQGGGTNATGGKGGKVTATISVTPGQVLSILVGKQGERIGTYIFGGHVGGTSSLNTNNNGFSGGGYSAILNNTSSISTSNLLVIAGGGGGNSGANLSGGNAGYPNGADGTSYWYNGTHEAGFGATQSSGGIRGNWVDYQTDIPIAGVQFNGGYGGSVNGGTGWSGGGGGGGGYYGGGGGAGGGSSNGAGAGGSSFAATKGTNTVSNIVYSGGFQAGSGYVSINW